MGRFGLLAACVLAAAITSWGLLGRLAAPGIDDLGSAGAKAPAPTMEAAVVQPRLRTPAVRRLPAGAGGSVPPRAGAGADAAVAPTKDLFDTVIEDLVWRQAEDGAWGDPAADGPGERAYATAAVVAALLEEGYSPRGEHPYARSVARGLRCMKRWAKQRDLGSGPAAAPRVRRDLRLVAAETAMWLRVCEMTGSHSFKRAARASLQALQAALDGGRLDDPTTAIWALRALGAALDIQARWQFRHAGHATSGLPGDPPGTGAPPPPSPIDGLDPSVFLGLARWCRPLTPGAPLIEQAARGLALGAFEVAEDRDIALAGWARELTPPVHEGPAADGPEAALAWGATSIALLGAPRAADEAWTATWEMAHAQRCLTWISGHALHRTDAGDPLPTGTPARLVLEQALRLDFGLGRRVRPAGRLFAATPPDRGSGRRAPIHAGR